MQRIIIDIPDNRINFFMELLNNLGFKKVRRLSDEEKEFVDDIKTVIGRSGKTPARNFLNEL
jgi:hypothetical protein